MIITDISISSKLSSSGRSSVGNVSLFKFTSALSEQRNTFLLTKCNFLLISMCQKKISVFEGVQTMLKATVTI